MNRNCRNGILRRAGAAATLPLLALLLCLKAQAQEAPSSEGGIYCGNGENGYVALYSAPGDAAPCGYRVNGDPAEDSAYSVDGSGRVWLYFPEWDGWAAEEDLLRVWNKTAFVAEHLDEFVMEKVTLDTAEWEDVRFWDYPGCGGVPGLVSWYMREGEDTVLTFPAYWVDAQGRRWGGYTFLNADGFICLDDPELEENGPEGETVIYPPCDVAALPRVMPQREAARGLSPRMRAVLAGCAIPLPLLIAVAIWWRVRQSRRRRK